MPPLPSDARRSLIVYNLFFPLVFAALLPGFARRMLRRGGFRENFGQRFGRYSEETRARFASGRWWWFHSISVGETLVALKLANELHRQNPAISVVITVTTSTGFALAAGTRSDWLEVLYNPIDAPAIVRAALDLIRPQRLVLIEGEAWPNLLLACRDRGIRTSLVNARLSPRSERRFLLARFWIAPIFRLLDQICVPERADLERWARLGIPAPRLALTGSIKFDTETDRPPKRTQELRAFLRNLGIPDDAPILVAGSTWHPEERLLAEILQQLRTRHPRLFLIIAPRHIERSAEILRDLEPLGLKIVRRTTLSAAPSGPAFLPPDVLLLDTTGELREWYAIASLVFIGKSLPGVAQTGGQNPAEPAALGKPIVAGPHMENFAALVSHLHSHRALHTAPDIATLRQALLHFLDHPGEATATGIRSREALLPHRGATAHTLAHLNSAG